MTPEVTAADRETMRKLLQRIAAHGNPDHNDGCGCHGVVIDSGCPHGRATYDRLRESLPDALRMLLAENAHLRRLNTLLEADQP
jgi:hypothetical protein